VGASLNGDDLPDVRVTFDGPLADFGTLEPRIDADDLAQFLTVARVERNVELLEELRRRREAAETPPEDDAPTQEGTGSAPPSETGGPDAGDAPLETLDPLPGFSTEIEETPEPANAPAPGAAQAAEPPADAPSAASAVPSGQLDDPDVVEDARREIMRDTPRRPPRQPERDPFFEIFRN
jgi:hypothetical protein